MLFVLQSQIENVLVETMVLVSQSKTICSAQKTFLFLNLQISIYILWFDSITSSHKKNLEVKF